MILREKAEREGRMALIDSQAEKQINQDDSEITLLDELSLRDFDDF